MTHQDETIIITGANSGVGFEAAAQFADAGWGRVVLACRSSAKAEDARARLEQRTGKAVFDTLVIDTSEVESAKAAALDLEARGIVADALVLNAGATGTEPKFNSEGIEITWASTLVGHHVLTMEMLARGLLAPQSRIIIAGSEGARGNLMGMKVHDIAGIAREHFGGDRSATIAALARIQHQGGFTNMDEYVTAKLVVAWWAGGLSRKLPPGMTVNAVSPGSAPASSFTRNTGFGMKVMLVFMKAVGPLIGMAGSLEVAAKRYLDAVELDEAETGKFYATVDRKKLVGPMGVQSWPEFLTDRGEQDAAFEAIAALTKTPLPKLDPARAAI